ncbi:membrane protein Ycf1 [Medicago truncatula]|uniref:Membrane protein Ycf1 n=1 Tax=Medicago truncatula TaxID=3880 RepID=G7I5S7_MEDTR|nr:membrane protein Ycf1 [Medicago truncatula]
MIHNREELLYPGRIFAYEADKILKFLYFDMQNWNIKRILKSILFRFKIIDETIDELSESKKTSTISKNNSKIEVIEESPVKMESINWTNSSFTEKRIKDLNVKTKTIIKQIETMTEEKKEAHISNIYISHGRAIISQMHDELFLQIVKTNFLTLSLYLYMYYVPNLNLDPTIM